MRFVKSFWKTILWALIVLVLSTMSGKKVEEIPFMNIPNMDKVAHFGMYFILTFLLLFDFSRLKSDKTPGKKVILITLLLAIFFGGSMELLQEIPSLQRSTDIKDFMANSIGAFSAALSFRYIEGKITKLISQFYKARE